MNFAKMVADMDDAAFAADDTDGLTDVQIIGRLKSVHELRAGKHTFTPGQIVRHRFPDQMNNSRTAKTPGMFIRYLDKCITVADHPEAFEDITDWCTMAATFQYDCVIGFIVHGISTQNNYLEFFENAGEWRPATEADYGPIVSID